MMKNNIPELANPTALGLKTISSVDERVFSSPVIVMNPLLPTAL
jgi:hypothetical protein